MINWNLHSAARLQHTLHASVASADVQCVNPRLQRTTLGSATLAMLFFAGEQDGAGVCAFLGPDIAACRSSLRICRVWAASKPRAERNPHNPSCRYSTPAQLQIASIRSKQRWCKWQSGVVGRQDALHSGVQHNSARAARNITRE